MKHHLLGHDPRRPLDAILVNSPLKNYDEQPRHNDFTLPVLGLGYIASVAEADGLNVGVVDVEADGLGLGQAAAVVNEYRPRWVGLNLLAPTYKHSVSLLRRLEPEIQVMLGGHQAKAMPHEILSDESIPRIDALILGEADTRVSAILQDFANRERLPGVLFRGGKAQLVQCASRPHNGSWLAPDVDSLPLINREFLAADPFRADDGRLEAALIGSRGCPYDCSFCGAAKSANPDVRWRTRHPDSILDEMTALERDYGVSAVRFVDDLFLAFPQFMRKCLPAFVAAGIGDRMVWDATGRINVLDKVGDEMLDLMASSGCREVALGIESGSERMLARIDKRISPDMTKRVVDRLLRHGIAVKGYFILGFPTETVAEMEATAALVRELWDVADRVDGSFRASVFEFRPYPGTPEWHRLLADGYSAAELLDYQHVDLTAAGGDAAMRERDEFNFSSNIQFGEASVELVRTSLTELTREQDQRKRAALARPRADAA